MEKKFSKVIGLTILFLIVSSFNLFFENRVWAATVTQTSGGEVEQDVIVDIEEMYESTQIFEIHTTVIVDNGNEIPTDKPIYAINFNLGTWINLSESKDGTVTLSDGNDYKFSIRLADSNGEYVTISNGIYEVECNERYPYLFNFAYIDANCPKEYWEGAEFEFVLEPVNGGEMISYVATFSDDEIRIEDGPLTLERIEHVTLGDAVWGLVTGDTAVVGKLITQVLSKIALPCGDSFLHMISLAIGEPVTIDKAVFNEIQKLNINFFEPKDSTGSDKSLKNIMYDVVNTWYGIFRNIAVTVYLILLVYIGIKILFASTGTTKADYKKTFMAWVMGVAMLMFFPYVMKYAIELNNAFCIWLGEGLASIEQSNGSNFESKTESTELKDKNGNKMSLTEGARYYGGYEFVMLMLGVIDERDIDGNGEISESEATAFASTAFTNNVFGSNAMMRIRFIAQLNLDFPLTIVYFILIGQLLAILIVYYKRVFMLAFLITIFPLVVITYPLNKIGDIKHNAFGTWFKEFLVNVLVQTFHAVTYVVVVSVGVNSYIQNDNWLFMILCILFLFEGEKIIRAIFNVKSAANTIGDLAVAGAMAMSVAGKLAPTGGGGGGKKKDAEDPEAKAKSDREKAASHAKPGQTRGAEQNMAAATGGNPPGAGGASSGNGSGGNSDPQIPASPTGQFDFVKKKVDSWRPKHGAARLAGWAGKGAGYLAGKSLKLAAKGTGAVLGFTLGAAQGKAATALATGVAGAKMGEGLASGVTNMVGGAIGKARDMYAAGVVADEILNGDYDEELGISEADSDAERARAQKMREVMAKAARVKGRSGNTSAEIRFIQDTLDRLKKE